MTLWRNYQEQVAALFRDLGCSAEVEASVQGARATHDVDVWVVFERFGLQHKWVVECKYWNDPVPKEKIGILKYVVDDVGADKGVLVAKSGFQPGAMDASRSTNIVLTSLPNLRSSVEEDLQTSLIEQLERKTINLRDRHSALYIHEEDERGATLYPRPGVDSENYIAIGAIISALEHGFRRVAVDTFPAPIGIDFESDGYKMAKNKKEFVELAGETVEYVDNWVSAQETAIEASL